MSKKELMTCRRVVNVSVVGLAFISILVALRLGRPVSLDSERQSQSMPNVALAADARVPQAAAADHAQRIVREGIAVEFTIVPANSQQRPAKGPDKGELVEGDAVTVRFKITDTTTGTPATTLEPAGWLHPAKDDVSTESKVKSFLTGSLASRAEIDLNAFYALALNENASISVVDPLFGYGGSKLLAMIRLGSPGQDWVLSPDQSRLFVTMPDVNQVAVVDTATWKVRKNIDTGATPMRICVQPDGKYLWVGCDGANDADSTSGVTVIDGGTLEVADDIPLGAGHHEIAFTDDSHYAFVTNQAADTLSVVDIRKLKVAKEINTGRGSSCVAFCELSQAAYIVNEADGSIIVVDGRSLEPIKRIQAKPGVKVVQFSPHGRFGFAVNPRESLLHIIDASTHRIVQSGEVGKNPDQIAFTENLAYVRSLGTEQVFMIPLDQIGTQGAQIPVIDFTGGHRPFGQTPLPSIAAGIAPAPGGISVLVANPADKTIYYYREGMAAPMGEFQNYGRQPRAVLVVDSSLREVEPGVYSTDVKLDLSGKVDCCFFLDAPRIVHCFQFDVQPNRQSDDSVPTVPLEVQPLVSNRIIPVGESVKVRFRVIDPQSGQPRLRLQDLGVLVNTPGNWQTRQWARYQDDGIYEIEFTPPQAGTYYVSFQCPSLHVRFNEIPPLLLTVANEG